MGKVTEIRPEMGHVDVPDNVVKVFLAGTIDCGNSEDWQHYYIETLKQDNVFDKDVYVFNPRRAAGCGISVDNTEEMEYQINWELDKMEEADHIVMKLLPNSKSPISLMELGLFAKTGKLVVFCSKDFYRYQNVKIVCERNNVTFLPF